MRIIEPKVELLKQESGLEGIYKQIERVGRTCYKSESKITEDSAKPFVDRMINSGHCYTGDSEVLTIEGWVKWKEYAGQKVAVVNSDLSFKGFEIPKRIVKHCYEGKFYEYPSLGLKVTDGHKMFGLFRTKDSDFYNSQNYQLFQCDENYRDQNGREKTLGERMFKTPNHCSKPANTNPYMELVGFWLGDGCHQETTPNKLVFHLKKERKIKYLKELARQLGYTFEVGLGNYYRISKQGIGSHFNELYYRDGNKYINTEYSPLDIHSIIIGLINSDGSLGINTKTITFASTSKSVIDWIRTYAPIAGYTISYRGICNTPNETQKPAYKILFLNTDYTINNDSRKKDSKVLITEEVNEVFCVTVSTGLILVRGVNGVTTVCGNCAMLEHGTVYLTIPVNYNTIYEGDNYAGDTRVDWSLGSGERYINNKYSSYKIIHHNPNDIYPNIPTGYNFKGGIHKQYVTTNMRVLVENKWLDDLKYICDPVEEHEKRISLKYTTSIGVSREGNRHRSFSIAEQSTRYCNYSKDKFGGEISFIKPSWEMEKQDRLIYEGQLSDAEYNYMQLIKDGWKPQQAREVLPLSTATEVVYTGFEKDWKHFFDLRYRETTGKAHPNMKQIATMAHDLILKELNLDL